MALPDISGANCFELLMLVENLDIIKVLLDNHRIQEGRPFDDSPSVEEFIFLATLSRGLLIKRALSELDPIDFINMWEKKTNNLRGPGPPPRTIYQVAWWYHRAYGLKLIEVYRKLVLPHLLETGEVAKKKNGQPDPTEDLEAQADFLKSMQGFRRKAEKQGN